MVFSTLLTYIKNNLNNDPEALKWLQQGTEILFKRGGGNQRQPEGQPPRRPEQPPVNPKIKQDNIQPARPV